MSSEHCTYVSRYVTIFGYFSKLKGVRQDKSLEEDTPLEELLTAIPNYLCVRKTEFKLQKFSPRFFGIKTASSSLIIFQRAKLSTRSITHLCWCN
jgi:hypothetical protein